MKKTNDGGHQNGGRRGNGRRGGRSTDPRGGKRGRNGKRPVSLNDVELMSVVIHLFFQGKGATEIAREINKRYPEYDFTRESANRFIAHAGGEGWLLFKPPPAGRLEDLLGREFPFLQHRSVVRTRFFGDVADRTARELYDLIRAIARRDRRDEVHVGFAGGAAMKAVAEALMRRLCDHAFDLPRVIYFHAIVSGFQPEDPTTEPNAFLARIQVPELQVEPRYKALSAPSMVTPQLIPLLRGLPEIEDAFRSVNEIDIFVTSGSDWRDDHSALKLRMQHSPESMRILEENDCVGDILCRPISRSGPIETETELRALTLIELRDLPRLIRKHNKRVLMMIGPCAICHEPKDELLRAVLNQKHPLVTDLVVDSNTASLVLERPAHAEPAA